MAFVFTRMSMQSYVRMYIQLFVYMYLNSTLPKWVFFLVNTHEQICVLILIATVSLLSGLCSRSERAYELHLIKLTSNELLKTTVMFINHRME